MINTMAARRWLEVFDIYGTHAALSEASLLALVDSGFYHRLVDVKFSAYVTDTASEVGVPEVAEAVREWLYNQEVQ